MTGGVARIAAAGTTALLSQITEIIGLTKELPNNMRPDWLGDFIKGTEETAEALKQVGRETSKWGKDRVASFGESADAARKFFEAFGNNDQK